MPLPEFVTRSTIDPSKQPKSPSILPEKRWGKLHNSIYVAGIDEAGRGPLAGPVVASAVVFNLSGKPPKGINDSKKLTHEQRVLLAEQIKNASVAWGVGRAEPWEIDEINILQATKLAAVRAIEQANTMLAAVVGLHAAIDCLVTDALDLPAYPCPQLMLIKGDQRSTSVAAASILAKVTRDEIMCRFADQYPNYGWRINKGYPTPEHRRALLELGPSSWHRFSYKTVSACTLPVVRSAAFQRLFALGSNLQVEEKERFQGVINELERCRMDIPQEDFNHLRLLLGNVFSEIVKKNTNFSLESAANP
ncbi:MAG: ribonuclease HII [Sumerlaeia bacterium]